jgi:hypothetical protein
MSGLRVLITNNTLADRAGTELYVRDLALALLDRGHQPIAFSTYLGTVAAELRSATVPVIDRLDALAEPPDVIHGHHHVETLLALTHFPDTPALFICHGWAPWEEHPPRFGRIRRYLAVDEPCRDRLVCENGFPPERVELLLNFVDLGRFQRRGPLPERPRKALLFANTAREDTYLPAVREACGRAGVELDVAGTGVGRPLEHPERELGKYDLVFGKGRAALEALAVGSAVILCDLEGAGPLVRSDRYDELRRRNFGLRALRSPHTAEHYEAEIRRYAAADAAALCTRIRSEADREGTIDRLVTIYRDVLAENRAVGPPDRAAELSDLNAYLRWLAPRNLDLAKVHHALQETAGAVQHLQTANEQLHAELAARVVEHHRQWRQLQADQAALVAQVAESERARAALVAERHTLAEELAAMRATLAWRLNLRLRRVPGLRPALGWMRRLARPLRGI